MLCYVTLCYVTLMMVCFLSQKCAIIAKSEKKQYFGIPGLMTWQLSGINS